MSTKIKASELPAVTLELLVKMQRLVQIQKTNPFESPEWTAASEALSGVWPELAKLNAPSPDQIDWAS